jgi:hypothetical protein
MPNIVTCPSCTAKLQVSESALDVSVACPICRHIFRPSSLASAIRPEPVAPPARPPGTAQPSVSPEAFQEKDALIDPQLPSAGVEGHRSDYRTPPIRQQGRYEEFEEEDDYARRISRPLFLGGAGRATAAIIMLLITLGVEAIGICLSYVYFKMLDPAQGFPDLERIRTIEEVRAPLGLLEVALLVGTAVVFLTWFYTAHANLKLLRARGLQYSPGWAVGYFFIPIVNLFRPYQIMQEIWKASDPSDADRGRSAGRASPRGSTVAGFWWTCWLLSNFLGNLRLRFDLARAPSIEEARIGAMYDVIGGLFFIAAGLLLIFLIKGIVRRQNEKFELLSQEETYDQF